MLDTGSTDDTVKKLRAGRRLFRRRSSRRGALIQRNESLTLIPKTADLCCRCIDLDEQFRPAGAKAGGSVAAGHNARSLPLHGASSPMGARAASFGRIRSTKRCATAGRARCMRCWNTPARVQSSLLTLRVCNSTTIPTPANRAGSICRFWSLRCAKRAGQRP